MKDLKHVKIFEQFEEEVAMNSTEEIIYCGVANENGIKSFQPLSPRSKGETEFANVIKSKAFNGVTFKAWINREDAAEIEKLVSQPNSSKINQLIALDILNKKNKKIQLSNYGTTKEDVESKWKSITNSL